jgi:hypothetical protein
MMLKFQLPEGVRPDYVLGVLERAITSHPLPKGYRRSYQIMEDGIWEGAERVGTKYRHCFSVDSTLHAASLVWYTPLDRAVWVAAPKGAYHGTEYGDFHTKTSAVIQGELDVLLGAVEVVAP